MAQRGKILSEIKNSNLLLSNNKNISSEAEKAFKMEI